MSEMDDVVRYIANTSLKLLLGFRYTQLLGLSSDELYQRVQLLTEPEFTKEQEFQLFQWNHGIDYKELTKYKNELNYSVPVRYKRFDSNDLRAFIEIQKKNKEDNEELGIVLRLEEGWVYFDLCRGVSAEDNSTWKDSIEQAEEDFHKNCSNTIQNQKMEEAEAAYWAQYGKTASDEEQEQEQSKQDSKSEETDYWSQYDQVNVVLDPTEEDPEFYRSPNRNEDKTYVELEVSDDFLKELENIEKEELLSSESQSTSVREREDEFIQVSASTPTESRNEINHKEEAFPTPQLVSPASPSSNIHQNTLTQGSSPQTPSNPPNLCSTMSPNSEMASRLDLTTMLTFAMGNINNLQTQKTQKTQWKPLISQLLRTSRDMAKLAGLSNVELSELLHDAYGDIVPSL